MSERRYSAGSAVEDRCRVCKDTRRHTVIVADGAGRPLRVVCDHCGSQHNFRGGESAGGPPAASSTYAAPSEAPAGASAGASIVSAREISAPREGGSMSMESTDLGELEALFRRVIREETGVTPVEMTDRFRGGELVLVPGREGTQEKRIPIETFFAKLTAVRNRLRVLEQQINGAEELSPDARAKLQGYVTAAYGSLTTFNVLFKKEGDRFKGSGG